MSPSTPIESIGSLREELKRYKALWPLKGSSCPAIRYLLAQYGLITRGYFDPAALPVDPPAKVPPARPRLPSPVELADGFLVHIHIIALERFQVYKFTPLLSMQCMWLHGKSPLQRLPLETCRVLEAQSYQPDM